MGPAGQRWAWEGLRWALGVLSRPQGSEVGPSGMRWALGHLRWAREGLSRAPEGLE